MKFDVTRKLSDKVFTSTVKFNSYGVIDTTQTDEDSEVVVMSMTPEEEKAIFEDFGYPVIEVGGEYSGYVKVEKVDEKDKVTLVTQETEGAIAITFVRNVEKYTLNETFEVRYSSNAKKLQDVEDGLTALQQSEAKCLVFEKSVQDKIKAAIEEVKSAYTPFEKVDPAHSFSY